jgi:ribosome-interacting GTPase 1
LCAPRRVSMDGVLVSATGQCIHARTRARAQVMHEYRIHNADVLFREDYT